MWSTSQYDLINIHGARLCDYVKCRKHTNLIEKFQGIFCEHHAKEIERIRENIFTLKHADDRRTLEVVRREIEWRTEEMLARKRFCAAHVRRVRILENLHEELGN